MTAIDAYVRDLHRAVGRSPLPGTRTPVIVTEARDHLLDAAEAWEARGLAPADAEQRAVAEFGDIDELAPGYRSVFALAQVRRVAWVLVVTMMIQPFVWDVGHYKAANEQQPAAGLQDLIEKVGGSLIVAGLLAAVLCSFGVRWWGVRSWMVRGTAAAMILGAFVLTAMALALAWTGGPTVRDVGLVTTFVVAPMAAVVALSLRGLAGARAGVVRS